MAATITHRAFSKSPPVKMLWKRVPCFSISALNLSRKDLDLLLRSTQSLDTDTGFLRTRNSGIRRECELFPPQSTHSMICEACFLSVTCCADVAKQRCFRCIMIRRGKAIETRTSKSACFGIPRMLGLAHMEMTNDLTLLQGFDQNIKRRCW